MNIPSCPDYVYKNSGWSDWGEFLGSGTSGKKTLQEWVQVAEQIAKEQGELPAHVWMRGNGYGALARMISINPQAFEHIPQKRLKPRAVARDVQGAVNMLLKQHEGVLPPPVWLKKNGYSWLYYELRKRPIDGVTKGSSFATAHTVDEWVKIAEALTSEHHGYLPSAQWLQSNGYSALYACWRINKTKFSHIPIKRKHKVRSSPAEVIEIVKGIIKEQGSWPSTYWLNKNGFAWLIKRVRENAELKRIVECS